MSGYFSCPHCGAQIESDIGRATLRCDYCRSEIQNPLYADDPGNICRNCGGMLQDGEPNCIFCGEPVKGFRRTVQVDRSAVQRDFGSVNPALGKPKNKLVAMFLCFFFGYLGAHKFYEGKFFAGFFYICTFGGFFIGVWIDLVALALKPKTYYV